MILQLHIYFNKVECAIFNIIVNLNAYDKHKFKNVLECLNCYDPLYLNDNCKILLEYEITDKVLIFLEITYKKKKLICINNIIDNYGILACIFLNRDKWSISLKTYITGYSLKDSMFLIPFVRFMLLDKNIYDRYNTYRLFTSERRLIGYVALHRNLNVDS